MREKMSEEICGEFNPMSFFGGENVREVKVRLF